MPPWMLLLRLTQSYRRCDRQRGELIGRVVLIGIGILVAAGII